MKKLSDLKISPVPWFVGDAMPYHEEHVVCTHNHRHDDGSRHDKVIATCNRYFEESIADARLIAVAPKMYARAWELITAFDERIMSPKHIEELRAALAEAAGEEVDDGK